METQSTVSLVIDRQIVIAGSDSNETDNSTSTEKVVNTSDIEQNSMNLDTSSNDSTASLTLVIILALAGVASIFLMTITIYFVKISLKKRLEKKY